MSQATHSLPRQRNSSTESGVIVNWRLAIATLILVPICVALVHLRYRSQLHVTVDSLLQQADSFEEKGEWREVARVLYDYSQLKGTDADTSRRLAHAYAQFANSYQERERAVELHHVALGRLPDQDERRSDLYSGLAEMLVLQGRFSEAEDAAAHLPAGPGRARIEALSQIWKAESGGAASNVQLRIDVQEAVKLNPTDISLAVMAVGIFFDGLSTKQDKAKADEIMGNLVIAATGENDDDLLARALLARHRYRQQYRRGDVGPDLLRALSLELEEGPVRRQLLVEGGNYYMRRRDQAAMDEDLTKAATCFRSAIDIDPTVADAHLGLGRCLKFQQDAKTAIHAWTQGISGVTSSDGKLELRMNIVETMMDAASEFSEEVRRSEWEILNATAEEVIRTASWNASRWQTLNVRARVQLLKARMLIAEGESESLDKASEELDSVATVYRGTAPDGQSRAIAVQCEKMRAVLWAVRDQWSKAAEHYENLAAMNQDAIGWMVTAADAWTRAGALDKAASWYRRAIKHEDATEQVFLAALQGEYRYQSQRSAPERDWSLFEQFLMQGRGRYTKSWRLLLLEANRRLVSGRPTGTGQPVTVEVEQLLSDAEAVAPDDINLWQQLVGIYNRLGKADDADRALIRLEQLVPEDQSLFVRSKSRLLWTRGSTDECIEFLDSSLENFEGHQLELVIWELARAHVMTGDLDRGKETLLRLPEPWGVPAQFALAELDLKRKDLASVKKWEDGLEVLEGADGIRWRYVRAVRLLRDRADDRTLTTTRALLQDLSARVGTWSRTHLLRAEIQVAEGQLSEAANSYMQAIAAGDRSVDTFEKLVAALYASNRHEEVGRLVENFSLLNSSSPLLSTLSISMAAQAGDLTTALKRAQNARDAHADNPLSAIWLAQVFTARGETELAEKELLTAVSTWPNDVRSWGALILFYRGAEDFKAAEKTLARFQNEVKEVPQAGKLSFAAQSHLWLGNTQKALDNYHASLQVEPKDNDVRMQLAKLLDGMRKYDEVERQIRIILENDPQHHLARRVLASLLSKRGGEAAWSEIERLVAEDQMGNSIEDQRFLAILNVRHNTPERRAIAKSIIQNLIDAGTAIAGDRVLLAVAHIADGESKQARDQFEEVVKPNDVAPVHLASYLQFLINEKDRVRTTELLERFDEVTQNDPVQRLNFITIKANHDAQTGKLGSMPEWANRQLNEIISAETELKDEAIMLFAAQLFDRYGLVSQAEPWFRKLVAAMPERFPELAVNLAKQRRYEEALNVCLDASDKKSKVFVRTAVLILLSPQVPTPLYQTMEPLISEAVEQHDGDVDVLFDVANLYAARSRRDDAIRLLMAAVAIQPNHIQVRNNLATLLGEKPGYEEAALEHVDHAISVVGEQSSLLDTKGTILIGLDAAKAIRILERAVAVTTPDPRSILHLAHAYHASGHDDLAKLNLKRAMSLDVDKLVLTDSDRELLATLPPKYLAEQ